MADYALRNLEIHGPNMWNMWHVDKAIQFAKKFDMTGLIFHCNELIDKLVLPFKYFPKDLSLERWPVREATLLNNRYYISEVIRRCRENGLEFYAEVKELYYPNEIIELYPDLRKENGAVCPTEPFWWEFLEQKITEFVELIPDAAGIIISAGTRESMVSLAANGCVCDRCQNYDIDTWYAQVLEAMFKPLDAKGKQLIVRDFAYTDDHQFAMIHAAASVSDKISMAMKKTPHDYYPTFPDNPAVGNCGKLGQWIEFDTWGQYFGLGFIPCSVVEDMQGRLQRYLEKGASGVMMRTDWEIVSQGSVFNSFNTLNLIAGAMLSKDVNTPLEQIYQSWVEDGLYSPLIHDSFPQEPCVPTGEDAVQNLTDFMKTSWDILEKTIYARGHVFQENGQFPETIDLAFNMMVKFHRRDYWDPWAHLLVEPTAENIDIILREKDEAVQLVKTLPGLVKAETLQLTPNIRHYLSELFEMYDIYVRAFRAIAETCFLVRKAELSRDKGDIDAASSTLPIFAELSDEVKAKVHNKGYSNEVVWCMDYTRLLNLKKDAESILSTL